MTPEETKTELNLTMVKDKFSLLDLWNYIAKDKLTFNTTRFYIVMFLVLLFFAGFTNLALYVMLSPGASETWTGVLTLGVFVIAIGTIIFWAIAQKARIDLRAISLAQANGFYFKKEHKNPDYSGLIFSIGDTKKALSVVEGVYKSHEFKLFNYSYTTGSGKNRSEVRKGVIMVKLPRKVPHVVFDSKSNNFWGVNSLGTSFARSQRFTFEGDFNKHFDVYAPQNYGRDVLYFMTPELMALLVDKADKYDIEVVDDNLFFYAKEFDYKRNQLETIFRLIETMGGEFSENTQRYADERIGDKSLNLISESGRRLKRGISWTLIFFFVLNLFYFAAIILSS